MTIMMIIGLILLPLAWIFMGAANKPNKKPTISGSSEKLNARPSGN